MPQLENGLGRATTRRPQSREREQKMIRNLKALGLALVALFAMSAVVASSASAVTNITTTSGPYPKHLIADDIGVEDIFKVGTSEITCHGETYTTQLEGPSTSIEVTPEYGETCRTKTSPHWNVTVTENGCKIKFAVVAHGAVTDEDKVSAEVVCAAGKVIEIHHFAENVTPHSSLRCTNTVHAQKAGGTLTATSLTATGDIELHGTVTLVDTTHGPCSFGFTLNQEAEFIASTTLKDTAGTRIHIG